MQAVVECNHDRNGIMWPSAIAPYVVAVMPLNVKSHEHTRIAEGIYDALIKADVPAALDDRSLRPGQKFAEAELVGYPIRLVIGDKSLKDSAVEVQYRDGRQSRLISVERVAELLIKDLADTTL